MELRLQEFIQSVATLADIRNLDQWNPIVFQLEHPINATRFTIVGAKQEPSYLGIPVNTTWVVLDPESEYYNRALKLVDTNDPDQATTIPNVLSGEDGTVLLYWNIIRTYDEIFEDPQYYNNGGRGPKGDKGDKGDPGVINYATLISRLAELTGLAEIVGPSSVQEGSTQQYRVQLSEPKILADGTVSPPVTEFVDVPIYLTGAIPQGTSLSASNVLTTGLVSANTPVRLYAEVPSWGRNVFANLDVLITDVAAEVTGITITGPTSLNSGSTGQYALSASWSDGTVTYVDGVWSLDSEDFGTLSQLGLLNIPSDIAGSGTVQVGAVVTLGDIEYTPSIAVMVTKQVVPVTLTGLVVEGPASVSSNTSETFRAVATWSDGTVTYPTASWGLSSPAFGSISGSGVLTVPDSISSSGTVQVTATVVLNGTEHTQSTSVQIVKIVVPPSVSSVSITGPASVYTGSTGQYALSVLWSNGTTTTPAASSWSVGESNAGAISASGLLSVSSDLDGDEDIFLEANVDINGEEYTAERTVSAILVVPTGASVQGPDSIVEGTTSQFTFRVTWNNGTTTTEVPQWSHAPVARGSISVSGLFTSIAGQTGNLNIVGSWQHGTTFWGADKILTVTSAVVAVTPRWGIGPALPTDWTAFVSGLTVAPSMEANGKYQVSFDSLGSNSYMYFVYPKSHGEATFFDKLSQFFGGWGGAGNSGPGPSAASSTQYKDVPHTTNVSINGASVEVYVYRTDFANLGAAAQNQWEVTLATP